MKKSQSAIEAAILISFMSFALIIFLVASYQRALEAQEKNEKETLSGLITVIETELSLASAASDGYYRVFELPPLINGREYDITFAESKYIGANFSEVEIRYLNSSLVDNTVTPANIIGRICKGRNVIAKTAGVANISCVECSNSVDDDLNSCVDYPADSGCSNPDDPSESGGICSGECSDAQDNDFNGCADYPYDTGCSSASDQTESGGTCQCTDGTPFGQCSADKPKYCSAGTLIDACGAPQNCGCDSGFTCQGNACIPTTIDCTITASCSYTDLFHISNSTNAHAEISSLSNYPNKVCCGSAEPIDPSCTSPDTKLLALSTTTNAHAEKISQTDYPIEVCMSSASTITCSYVASAGNGFTACTSAGYHTCAVTISADTDAHVADCITDPYDIKVCCKIGV